MRRVIVIGAGAAGSMAAIFAASEGADTLLIERTRDGGRKILISGGGRCNVLPSRVDESRFVTDSSPNLLKKMVRAWPLAEQRAFFEDTLGIPLEEETESLKLFPASHKARDVRDGLLDYARKVGVRLRMETSVVDIAPVNGGWEVTVDDGTVLKADAVIGADGVHSLIREQMLGPEKPRFTGRVAYRTTFPASRIKGVTMAPVRTKWWGADRHMVVYFVTRNRDELYFVTSVPEKAEWMTPESWSAKGDLEELRAAYAGFHPEVQAILQACPEVYKWALFERDPLPRWSEGRVALLGDACHPMTPYMAQGAASALEDAAILSRVLTGVEADGLAAAFKLYEAIRKPRASAIQAGSSANTWLKGKTDPSWVYGYDSTTVPLREPEAA